LHEILFFRLFCVGAERDLRVTASDDGDDGGALITMVIVEKSRKIVLDFALPTDILKYSRRKCADHFCC